MNRSILIVITDFWILSLLVLAKFDAPDVQRPNATPAARSGTHAGEKDVVEVLKLALSEEQKRRDALASELSATRQSLDLREQTVAAREQQLQALQQSLREKDQIGAQLAEQRTNLIEQMSLTQTNVVFLRDQLQTASTESLLTQEQLKLLQTQLARKEDELAKTRQRVEELDRQREATQMEKAQLSAQLQVVETEKRLVTQQVSHLSNEVQVVRAEKSTLQQHATQLAQGVDALAEKSTALVQGVDALAEKSTALTQEIRDNRELPANSIFAELATNRVTLRFVAQRKGLFGIPVQQDKSAQTILLSHAEQYFALCHVSDTPLSFSTPGFGYDSFQVSFEHGAVSVPVAKLQFLSIDPRILMVPLAETEARQLGVRIYRLAADPLKFTEAVLVGATEGYYGESKFQIDLSAPLYVRMDRSSFRILSSKFNPSRGDLVLSKTGELLGMMANSQYCAVLNRLNTIGEVVSAPETSASAMGSLLSRFDRALQQLPMKLQ